jgi:ABC-type uncharacterized transport system permease subunit
MGPMQPMQSRRESLIEAATNTVIGCLLGFAIAFAVMKVDMSSATAAAWIVGLNVPASAARQYVIRRLFNGASRQNDDG